MARRDLEGHDVAKPKHPLEISFSTGYPNLKTSLTSRTLSPKAGPEASGAPRQVPSAHRQWVPPPGRSGHWARSPGRAGQLRVGCSVALTVSTKCREPAHEHAPGEGAGACFSHLGLDVRPGPDEVFGSRHGRGGRRRFRPAQALQLRWRDMARDGRDAERRERGWGFRMQRN